MLDGPSAQAKVGVTGEVQAMNRKTLPSHSAERGAYWLDFPGPPIQTHGSTVALTVQSGPRHEQLLIFVGASEVSVKA
jgi:hypothetical protein